MTPFSNGPESLIDLIVFIESYISFFKIISVMLPELQIPGSRIFFGFLPPPLLMVLLLTLMEFAKSHAMRVCMPTWSTCQRACVPVWFTCQRACAPAWFTCQRACVLTCQKRVKFSFLLANVPKNVPTGHKACQCFNLTCQHAKQRANFSTWRANVPKSVPIF